MRGWIVEFEILTGRLKFYFRWIELNGKENYRSVFRSLDFQVYVGLERFLTSKSIFLIFKFFFNLILSISNLDP